ncbi:MAG: DUF4340 domain-containing protein [Clostridia bacterium]|nr:DUF4340 domain-containing protein [Clostridia bacterium]
MKNRKAVIFSVILILVIVSGLCVFFALSGRENAVVAYKDVFECRVSDIVGYTVEDGENGFALEKSGDEWQVKDDKTNALNQQKVQELLGNVSVISVLDVDSGISKAEFLKMPKQTVTVALSDGSVHKFEFAVLNKEKCALNISDGDEIFAAHLSLRDILVAKLENLRYKFLFDGLTESDEALTYYSYLDYDKKKTVVRMKDANELSKGKRTSYVMVEPYNEDVDDHLFEQQIAVNIPVLLAEKYVSNPENELSVYGLDRESRAELSFKWGTRAEVLYLGKNENGLVYGMLKNTDGIFMINAAKLGFLKTEPFYILDTGILVSEPEKVSSITVTSGDVAYTVSSRRAADGENNLYFVNDSPTTEENFADLVRMLDEIKLKGELLTVPENTDEIRIDITYGNGYSGQRLVFVSATDKDYAMFADGTAKFAVDKAAVDSFVNALDAASKNPLKKGEKG